VCPAKNCGNRKNFELDGEARTTRFGDWQRIRLQENENEVPSGSMPRSMDIIVRDEITEVCKPGDKILVTGSLIVVPDVPSMMSPAELKSSVRRSLDTRIDSSYGGEGVRGLSGLGQRDLTYKMMFFGCFVDEDSEWGSQSKGENVRSEEKVQLSQADKDKFQERMLASKAQFDAMRKEAGKSMLLEAVFIYNFEGDKVRRLSGIYADPDRLASIDNKNLDMPAQLMLPSFEPHPDPKAVFEAAFAAWGSGEFAAEETKQAAMERLIRPDILIDVSSSLLPDVFKVYRGHAGTDEWANGVIGQWEFTRFDSTVEAGLKPGCVMQKLVVDVTHKGTGKEAKGIRIYNELAYDAEGKGVYTKQFWANPAVAASLY